MSILVNKEGRVCVAHDNYYEGAPVGLEYTPACQSLALVMDNGLTKMLGSATMPEISRQLEKAQKVLVMQIRRPDPAQQFEVPLTIRSSE